MVLHMRQLLFEFVNLCLDILVVGIVFEEALVLLRKMVIVITQHLDVSLEILVLLDIFLEFSFVLIKLVDILTVRLLSIQVHSRRGRINDDKIGAISRSIGLECCV